MPVLVRQYHLKAPPEAVWAQLVAPDRWPGFVRHLEQAGWREEPGPAGDGSVEIAASYRGLLRWSGALGCRFDPASRDVRVWQTSNPVVEASGQLRVRPGLTGGTVVRIRAQYRALLPLAGIVVAAKLDGYLDKTARALEAAALTG